MSISAALKPQKLYSFCATVLSFFLHFDWNEADRVVDEDIIDNEH